MDQLMNPQEKKIKVRSEEITVSEFTVKTFRPVMHRVGVVMKLIDCLSKGKTDELARVAMDSYDGVIDIVCMNTGKDVKWLEDLALYEVVKLITAIIEVNEQSFLLMKGESEKLIEKLGSTIPKSSSETGQPASNS